MADQVLQHWEDFGTANTPTAPSGIRIDIVLEGVLADDGHTELHMNVTTTNFAMFDNATGGVKVMLVDGNNTVASYVVTSPRNPGRGFQPPTVRQGFRSEPLPANLKFNKVAFSYRNMDDANDFTIPWDRVIEIGVEILSTTLAAA